MKSGSLDHLDNQSLIKSLDSSSCLASIKNLPLQILTAWKCVSDMKLNPIPDISGIYFCGMGGSVYAGRIIKSLFRYSLTVPVEIVDNYHLPASVNKNSLIVCASYSGNTEETISACRQALSQKLNLIGVTSGGTLLGLLKANSKPVYVFEDKLNPSRQPRLGQGYIIASVLAFLAKLKLLEIDTKSISDLSNYLSCESEKLKESISLSLNPAKKLTIAFGEKVVNFVASEFLEGAVHAIRNPINESSKHFASYFIIPELNHHLLEGLKFPSGFQSQNIFAFIKSSFYSDKIKKRMNITKDVVSQNGLETIIIDLKGKSPFIQVFELIQLLNFVSFYLAVYHKINPAPVPWVDYLKEKLSR